jgi:hypothetical protein
LGLSWEIARVSREKIVSNVSRVGCRCGLKTANPHENDWHHRIPFEDGWEREKVLCPTEILFTFIKTFGSSLSEYLQLISIYQVENFILNYLTFAAA